MGRYDDVTSIGIGEDEISKYGSLGEDLGTGKYNKEKAPKDEAPRSSSGPVYESKYGDPNAPQTQQGMMAIQHLAAGRLDRRFYGHYLPEHFKKTSIINTKGRV